MKLKDHTEAAESMEWDLLAEIIMDMERDIYKMSPFLNTVERKNFEKIVKIYESEKNKRVINSTTYEHLMFDDYYED